jgi:hypothetical protein
MFLRFAVHARHKTSQRGRGLFSAIYDLEKNGRLAEYEAAWFSEQEQWFNENLERPEPLKSPLAILWFKSTALEHITRMRALAALVEHKDTVVDVIQSDRPGYVVYEDAYQVAAIP